MQVYEVLVEKVDQEFVTDQPSGLYSVFAKSEDEARELVSKTYTSDRRFRYDIKSVKCLGDAPDTVVTSRVEDSDWSW